MVKKKPTLQGTSLSERVETILLKGRTPQALEMVKQLHKQDPSAANRELLKRTHLERARQLRAQDRPRDAVIVLESVLRFGEDDPAWLAKAAEELALAGGIAAVLRVIDRIVDPAVRTLLQTRIADAALEQGESGRGLLSEDLRAGFDLVRRGFELAAAGHDEPARAALQEIGLQSPFLEWKLLLRGLIAYYQKDDVRALGNWQRLNPERLPAKLSAPLRVRIDPGFRAAQPAPTQLTLQKQSDRLSGSNLAAGLRGFQTALAHPDRIGDALRLAETLVPAVRQEAPQLVNRLASCSFWAIVNHGAPPEVTRYRRIFGAPPEDPDLDRLQALMFEHQELLEDAHKHWQRFEQAVARNPAAWRQSSTGDPEADANQVRALVLERMADMASHCERQLSFLPPFMRDRRDLPKLMQPDAETCLRRCLELAPDRRGPYRALFALYSMAEKYDQAEEIGRRLIERFPDDASDWQALAHLLMQRKDYGGAVELFRQAYQRQPLEPRLRKALSVAQLSHARQLAAEDQFDAARTAYAAALELDNPSERFATYCKWSVCELKAGHAERAEELHRQARAGGNSLGVAFTMLVETIRCKLPRARKSQYDKEFNAGLSEPPQAEAVAILLEMAAGYRASGTSYPAQATHEKKVIAYLDAAKKLEFSERQLEQVCGALLNLKSWRKFDAFCKLGQRRFKKNPYFFILEAQRHLSPSVPNSRTWHGEAALKKARALVEALPADDRQQELRTMIEELAESSPPNPFDTLPDFLGNMFDMLPLDDDDDDEDDDSEPFGFFNERSRRPRNKRKR